MEQGRQKATTTVRSWETPGRSRELQEPRAGCEDVKCDPGGPDRASPEPWRDSDWEETRQERGDSRHTPSLRGAGPAAHTDRASRSGEWAEGRGLGGT